MPAWLKSGRVLAWALCLVLACAYLALRFHGAAPVETNLLAMLPDDERHPAAEQALDKLANSAGERVVLLVGSSDAATASKAAAAAHAVLAKSPALREVTGPVGQFDLNKVLRDYAAYRFYLLSAEDRAALQANPDAWLHNALARRLMMPVGGPGLPLAEDPFGTFGNVLANLPLSSAKFAPRDGWLTVEGEGKTWRLLSARLAATAHQPAVQDQVIHALTGARQAALSAAPGVEVLATGTVLFASEARQQAESEMNVIGSVSTAGIVLLMLWLFRTPRHLLLALLSVGSGVAFAAAATLLWYDRLNLLTLVLGASLVGVAVDYPLHVFAHQMAQGQRWQVRGALKKLTPGLLLGLVTTLMGYAMLLVLPFPGLRQIALFSGAGLIAAWLTVQCLFPYFLAKPVARHASGLLRQVERFLAGYHRVLGQRRALWLVAGLLLVALPGLLALRTDDNVRQLIRPSDTLTRQEARIRELTGIGNSGQFFLVQGVSEGEVLARSAQLAAQLDGLKARGELQGYSALSSMVPSVELQQADHALLKRALLDNHRAKTALAEVGVRDELVDSYLHQLSADQPGVLTVARWLQMPISKPLRQLWLGAIDGQLAAVVLPQAFSSVQALQRAAHGLPGVTLVDKAGSTSLLFGEFRRTAAVAFGLAMLMTWGLLTWRYSWRRAVVLLVPTLLAVLLTLALLTYLGLAVHFFIVLAFMLVLGVGIDYGIFLEEGGVHNQAALLGVLLSAGTTLLSFGLLMLSATPAVYGFGLTLLAGVLLTVLLSPLVHLIGVKGEVAA
jgi:predicted exporter